MKKIIAVFIVLTAFSCSKPEKTKFTETALTEKLIARDNDLIAFQDILKKYKGQTLVIDVWASWCGDCIKSMPKMKVLQANHPEAVYLFISMDKTAERWQTAIERYNLKGDHFMAQDEMGGVFAVAIDLDWIPRYIIVDKTGKIVLYRAVETDFEKMEEILKKVN